eukprot:TRINITY_DN3839_c0_g1_i1.p1 TRINITY_DN3839_c0_g1~~TRINITY_DN3839_c0_g1_i1.p1  ORF type:complete len:889 (+),score=135.14 TRINITY_DN3839_c0_g1_i1:1-2667(+)
MMKRVTTPARRLGAVNRCYSSSKPRSDSSSSQGSIYDKKKSNNDPLSYDLIKRLPKADLHYHLDGGIRLETVLSLAKEQNISLKNFSGESTLEQLRKLVVVADSECHSLEDYLRGFDITCAVLQKPYALTRALYEICEDAVLDGVRYLEVRFSPILHIHQGMSLTQAMEAVVEGMAMAEHNLPIFIRIIVCGMRHMTPEQSLTLAEIAWRYKGKGVVAFDLAGPEHTFRAKDHKPAFDIVRKNLLNCTIHAGEGSGWQSIQDAVRYCGAQRIGHGTALLENRELWQYVIDQKIALECCATSNVHTKARGIQEFKDHPIKKYFDSGVICVPCTDNRTMSDVSLSDEYESYQLNFGFNVENMLRMMDYGFRAAFMDRVKKQRLRADCFFESCKILAEAGYDISSIISSNRDYWDVLGVDYTLFTDKHSLGTIIHEGKFNNPKITTKVIQQLPKTDLNVRLDSSISTEFLWSEIQRLLKHNNLNTTQLEQFLMDQIGVSGLKTKPDVQNLVDKYATNTTTKNDVERLVYLTMGTPEQMNRAVRDVLSHAKQTDNVYYMELMVRPKLYTNHLNIKSNVGADSFKTEEEVVQCLIHIRNQILNENHNAVESDSNSESGDKEAEGNNEYVKNSLPFSHVGLVLYSSDDDTPESVFTTAEIAAKYGTVRVGDKEPSSDICGFGFFSQKEVSESEYQAYQKSFDLLKRKQVNVCIYSGTTHAQNVVSALFLGGAARISGGRRLHSHPDVMQYLADHEIPVEVDLGAEFGEGQKLNETLNGHSTFVGSQGLRLLIDNDVKVTMCSMKGRENRGSRSEMLQRVVEECNLSADELLKILMNGFSGSFQSDCVRRRMEGLARRESIRYLESRGFHNLYKLQWFPAHSKSEEQFPPKRFGV